VMTEIWPQIVVEEGSVKQDRGGAITGIVFWRVGSRSFPDGAWNDSIIVVLSWWVQAVRRLCGGSSTSEMLKFMDGPFEVRLQREDDTVSFIFVNRRRGDHVEGACRGSVAELCGTLLKASAAVLRACDAANIRSSEIDELTAERDRLLCLGI